MSFIKDYRLIGQKMHEKKIRYYQVFDGDKSTIIDESSDSEDLTVEQAVNDLMETLGNLNGLVYVVIRRDDAPAKRRLSENKATASGDLYKGIYRYSVKIGSESESGGGYMSGGAGMFDRLLKMQEEKHALQLNHLKEMSEIEKRFMDRLEKLESKNKGGGMSEAMEQQLIELLIRINAKNG